MTKIRYNWLDNLQKGLGKKISRLLFYSWTSRKIITKFLHPEVFNKQIKSRPNKSYIDRNINRLCKLWENEGFLDKSRGIEIKDKWDRKIIIHYEMMNFEPIYKYCKERKIMFNNKEKDFLKILFLNDKYRYSILHEFPDEDIIHATLRFYVKYCVNKYHMLLRDVKENKDKYDSLEKKSEELNDNSPNRNKILIQLKSNMDKIEKRLSKKLKIPYRKSNFRYDIIYLISGNEINNITNELIKFKKRNKIDLLTYVLIEDISKLGISEKEKDKLIVLRRKNNIASIFASYIYRLQEDKELVNSVDKKILSALNLLPNMDFDISKELKN